MTNIYQGGDPNSGHGRWAWNPRLHAPEEPAADDSWEVRAFAEDYTGSVLGSTWPPRCYTCTFCKREFRSAQALGGHMNVHRRDRATKRLHQEFSLPMANITATTAIASTTPPATSSPALLIPSRDLANLNGGFCLLYQLPPQPNASMTSNNWYPMPPIDDTSYQAKSRPSSGYSQLVYSSKDGMSSAQTSNCHSTGANTDSKRSKGFGAEDLDLELRLGHGPLPS